MLTNFYLVYDSVCPSHKWFSMRIKRVNICSLWAWALLVRPSPLLPTLQVSGGLVWILILLAQVPVPLVQGWVLFVSVSCFIVTTLLLCLYIVGAHKNWSFWITLVSPALHVQGQGVVMDTPLGGGLFQCWVRSPPRPSSPQQPRAPAQEADCLSPPGSPGALPSPL